MESRTSMMNWKPLDVDLTARAIPRAKLLAAADRHGLAYVNSAALGNVVFAAAATTQNSGANLYQSAGF